MAFESYLVQIISDHVAVCRSSTRRIYREHARITRQQIERLRERLSEMGASLAVETQGDFSQRLHRLSLEVATMDVWRDEATQLLITSYGIKQLECTMYRSMASLADQIGDTKTATLARACLTEEESTARRLLFCIGGATRGAVA